MALVITTKAFGTTKPHGDGSERPFRSYRDLKGPTWRLPWQQTPFSQSPCEVVRMFCLCLAPHQQPPFRHPTGLFARECVVTWQERHATSSMKLLPQPQLRGFTVICTKYTEGHLGLVVHAAEGRSGKSSFHLLLKIKKMVKKLSVAASIQ